MFQIADARERIADTKRPQRPTSPPATAGGRSGAAAAASRPASRQKTRTEPSEGADLGLPESLVESPDLRAAIKGFLEPAAAPQTIAPDGVSSGRSASVGGQAGSSPRTDERSRAIRMARIQTTAAELGRQGRFDKAAELLSATIACGHAEPWMYEALAIALEAAETHRGRRLTRLPPVTTVPRRPAARGTRRPTRGSTGTRPARPVRVPPAPSVRSSGRAIRPWCWPGA